MPGISYFLKEYKHTMLLLGFGSSISQGPLYRRDPVRGRGSWESVTGVGRKLHGHGEATEIGVSLSKLASHS